MMSCFESVTLSFGGENYIVKPNMVMGLIESIECVLTIEEINEMITRKCLNRSKIARAYAAALNFAGASVLVEQVYAEFFGGAAVTFTTNTLVGLLSMMIPPEHLRSKETPKPKPTKPRKDRKL